MLSLRMSFLNYEDILRSSSVITFLLASFYYLLINLIWGRLALKLMLAFYSFIILDD